MHQGVILGEFVVATAQLLDHNLQFVGASVKANSGKLTLMLSPANGLVEDILEASSSVQHVAQLEAVGGQDTLVQHLNGRACRRLAWFPGELTALTTKSSSTTGIAPKLSVSDLRSPSSRPACGPSSRREHVPARLAV